MDISERNLWLVYALGYLACTLGQGSDLVISGQLYLLSYSYTIKSNLIKLHVAC